MFNRDATGQCPFLKGACIEGRCKLWVHMRGLNPQTGQEMDRTDCTLTFLPLLMIENSQQQKHTAAAVESFRNEMVTGQRQSLALLAAQARQALAFDAGA